MDTLSDRLSPHLLSLLRIVAALIFIEHGTQKLFGFPAAPANGYPEFLSLSGGRASSKSLAAFSFFSGFSRALSPSSSRATWLSLTGWSMRRRVSTLPSMAATPRSSTVSSSYTSRPRAADLGASTDFSSALEHILQYKPAAPNCPLERSSRDRVPDQAHRLKPEKALQPRLYSIARGRRHACQS